MVTLAPRLIGTMDFQGRPWVLQTAPWPPLIWCLDWALHGLLGDTGGVSMRSWCRKQLHNLFRQGSLGVPLPSLLSVLPNLLSWSGGKLQASLREKGVAFQSTISDVSQPHGELTACLLHARRCLNQVHVQSGAKTYPLLELERLSERKLFILHC